MPNPNPKRLLTVDKNFLDSIFVDNIFINITSKIREPLGKPGIYNQLLEFFKRYMPDKAAVLDEYIITKMGFSKLSELHIAISKWEKLLMRNKRPDIFSLVLRLQSGDTSEALKVYAITEDNVIKPLGVMIDKGFYKKMFNYLQFSDYVSSICEKYNLSHPLDYSGTQLMKRFKEAVRYKQIPLVDYEIPILSNTPGTQAIAYYDLNCGNPNNPTPAWDNFIAQFPTDEMRQSFMAWVYSVFKGDNFGRQLCVLHGQGNTGKSVIGNSISRRLELLNPNIATTLTDTRFADKYTAGTYLGKRFIMAADSQDYGIIRNNLIKNITGRDRVSIRRMGQAESGARVYSKIMVTTNGIPFVDTTKPEELSRILFYKLDKKLCEKQYRQWYDKGMGDFEEQINTEIDDFISKCKPYYDKFILPDTHNFRPYEGMEEILIEHNSNYKNDIAIWWKNCIMESPKDQITTQSLYKDYQRYIKDLKEYSLGIVRYRIDLFLEDMNIEPIGLNDVGHGQKSIQGYKFIARYAKDRLTNAQWVRAQLKNAS